ncbi:hypothetical protein [Streptomyces lydicus]|uniref:hypothetical protein n=1 Tax=Streptomyces lydicus TaxID=47763 RepID=UPI00378CEC29
MTQQNTDERSGADLKQRLTNGLDRLSAALTDGSAGGVKVTTRHGEPLITVPLRSL